MWRVLSRYGGLLLVALALAPFRASAGSTDALEAALRAEFARVDGDRRAAAHGWYLAAQASGRADHAERATQLALLERDYAQARRALALWRAAAPEAEEVELLEAVAALGLGDAAGAERALTLLLARGGRERAYKVLRLLSTEEARPLAAGLLEVLIELPSFRALPPEDVPVVPLALRLGAIDLAERVAGTASTQYPKSARAWLWRALVAQARKRTDAAAEYLTRAVSLAPQDVELRLALAQQLNDNGARAEIDRLLAAAPVQDELILAARIAYLAASKDRRALRRLERQIERQRGLDPEQRAFFLGQLAELAEDRDRALAAYRRVRQGPKAGEAQLRIAVLEAARDWSTAQALLQRLQDQAEDPTLRRDAYLLEAELLSGRQAYGEAAEVLSRALGVFLDDADLLYARALAYAQAEQVEHAELDLRLLIARDPNHGHALNALGYTLADRTDRLDEAYQYIRRALELLPNEAAVIDSMGWVEYRRGRLPEALEYLQRAYALNPDPEIAAHLGEVLWAKGRYEEARAVWRSALERAPDHPVLRATMVRLDAASLPQ